MTPEMLAISWTKLQLKNWTSPCNHLKIENHNIPWKFTLLMVDSGNRTITLCTKPLLFKACTFHQEYISFLIAITTKYPIILGFPWMHLPDTQISGSTKNSFSSHPIAWITACTFPTSWLLQLQWKALGPKLQQIFPQNILNSKMI